MKNKAVLGGTLPLVLALALGAALLNPRVTRAERECTYITQDSFLGTVQGVPPPGPENTSVGVLHARRVTGGEINYFGIPWNGYEGCITAGKWRFVAFDGPYGWSSGWQGDVTCTIIGPGPEVECGGEVSITLYRHIRDQNSPSNRPSCPRNRPAPGTCKAGKPVSVVTGNMFLDHTDFVLPGWGAGPDLTRSYNSSNAYFGVEGPFGAGWSHTYQKSLKVLEPQMLRIRDGDGVATIYWDADDDQTFGPYLPGGDTSTVVESGGSYTRDFPDGSYETYDSSGNLTSLVDTVGNTITLEYSSGQLTRITDPASRELTFTYTGSLITSAAGPGGLIATYTYDGDNLETATYPDGSGYTYSYGTRGRLKQVTDHEGVILEKHTYARQFTKTSEISAGQELYTFEYSEDSDPKPLNYTRVTDALGNVTTYDWATIAGARFVTKITGPCPACGASGSESQEWTYDDEGRVLSYKDGLGNTTTYTYDNNGYLASDTDSLNRTTSYTNDTQGRILTRTDPEGAVTEWAYGPAGPLTITDPLVRTTTFTYHPRGKPETTTNANNATITFEYDDVGNLISATDPLLNQTEYGYDLVSRRTSVTDPLGNTTETEYDSQGRVKKVANPDETFTEFTYDLGGRRTSVTDPLGRTTQHGYDGFGRLETVTDPVDGVTKYGYDSISNLTSITDARENVTTFDYDTFGRLEALIYPGGGRESISYDAAGRLVKKGASGSVIQYVFDGAGQLISKQYGMGGIGPFGFPSSSGIVTYEYDQAGRLTQAVWGVGPAGDTLTWTYDAAGQMLTESSTANASTISYTYDAAGNRKSLSLNGAQFLTYGYGAGGRLASITRGSNVFTFEYDDASRRTSLTYPNGVITSYGYDTLSRVTKVTTMLDQTVIAEANYTYDLTGNRLSKATDAFSEDYSYDPLYRLETVTRDLVLTEDYSYDEVGNRLSSLDHPLWTYNDRNQLLSVNGSTFSYDTRGNTVSRTDSTGSGTYEWDEENRLTQVRKGGRRVTFEYDPLGRRLHKKSDSRSTTRYTYDGVDILTKTVRTRGKTVKYIHGPGIDEPLAMEDSAGDLTFYHADGLGSIVKMTDQAGQVVSSYRYDAFGNIEIGVSQGGYSYTGREWDPEIGLYYYRARYYDPTTGRFLSEDTFARLTRGSARDVLSMMFAPFQYDDPALGSWLSDDPYELHDGVSRYSYVQNDPVNYTDPDGRLRLPKKIPRPTEMFNLYRCSLLYLECTRDGKKACLCREPGMNPRNVCISQEAYPCCRKQYFYCLTTAPIIGNVFFDPPPECFGRNYQDLF